MILSKLKSKKEINYIGKVYDLCFKNEHYFYANSNDKNEIKRSVLIHNSVPDIDLDHLAGTDDLTLNWLYEKYGKNRVVPVVTFGTFSEKGTLKDVVRALGHDTGFDSDVDAITKEMPSEPTWNPPYETLEKWFKLYPLSKDCSERVKNWILDPNNAEIISLTLKLQGQVRNLGKHAAGIVITPGPIWELMPVNICKGQIVSGFQESGNAKDISSIGGLKLDRLKLETLNVIKDALFYIKERHGEEVFNTVETEIKYIHYKDDKNLFTELRLGNNQGVFQFESDGMGALIKSMQTENLNELVAANALYRPGTMSIKAHEEFVKNKFNPKQRTYASPALAPLLEETNGVLIYQEQLMFIANKLGGLTLGEGDNLRKAMDGASHILKKKLNGDDLTDDESNNKNYKSYKVLWAKFIDGAKKSGLSDSDVENIESWLAKYLGYSFNKCLTENHYVEHQEKGKLKINKIQKGDFILCYNSKELKNEYCKVKNIHHNGKKDVYRITTESGKQLECTLDHNIETNLGMMKLSDILKSNLKIKIK